MTKCRESVIHLTANPVWRQARLSWREGPTMNHVAVSSGGIYGEVGVVGTPH